MTAAWSTHVSVATTSSFARDAGCESIFTTLVADSVVATMYVPVVIVNTAMVLPLYVTLMTLAIHMLALPQPGQLATGLIF